MTHPDLSICIVNWNGREMLRNLLASIAATRGSLSIETIVVDNASADGSADMVAVDFPDVILIRNSHNAGFARGNNQAMNAATGRLLLFLNNDTIVRPDALAQLVHFLDAHPECAAVGPQLIGLDGLPQQTGRNLPTFSALLHQILLLKWTNLFKPAYRRYRRGSFDPHRSGPIQQLAAAAFLVRADQCRSCNGFDEGFPFGVEDVNLCARLSRFGSIYYLCEAQIEHLGRISSRANRAFVYRGYECGYARYLHKHASLPASLLYKLLVTFDMPFRILLLATQTLTNRLLGRPDRAQRSAARLSAASHFALFSLPQFWRS